MRLEVLHHVHCTYEVVRVDGLQSLFQLSVAHVGLVSVVSIWVTMTHESYDVVGSLICIQLVQLLSNSWNIYVSILQQRHTQLQGYICQIVIVEVTVRVVGKVFDVVDHAGVLLTRDHLQRLYHDLAVLHTFLSEGSQPVVRSVEVA